MAGAFIVHSAACDAVSSQPIKRLIEKPIDHQHYQVRCARLNYFYEFHCPNGHCVFGSIEKSLERRSY